MNHGLSLLLFLFNSLQFQLILLQQLFIDLFDVVAGILDEDVEDVLFGLLQIRSQLEQPARIDVEVVGDKGADHFLF